MFSFLAELPPYDVLSGTAALTLLSVTVAVLVYLGKTQMELSERIAKLKEEIREASGDSSKERRCEKLSGQSAKLVWADLALVLLAFALFLKVLALQYPKASANSHQALNARLSIVQHLSLNGLIFILMSLVLVLLLGIHLQRDRDIWCKWTRLKFNRSPATMQQLWPVTLPSGLPDKPISFGGADPIKVLSALDAGTVGGSKVILALVQTRSPSTGNKSNARRGCLARIIARLLCSRERAD
jgi:hypothetical protein